MIYNFSLLDLGPSRLNSEFEEVSYINKIETIVLPEVM